jgi:tetratricopeptide (TPR) repeat protein
MGPERTRKRQHVHLSVACLILISIVACVPCKQTPSEPQAPPPAVQSARDECVHLESVKGFISQGDFDGAMKASQDILANSPKTPPGDAALMNLGLISAHYANPKRDYKKSLNFFQRIEKEYPESPLVEEAKIWISVLQAFEKAKQVDLEIEQKKKGLAK